jgi:large subunit ribosomal protein L5
MADEKKPSKKSDADPAQQKAAKAGKTEKGEKAGRGGKGDTGGKKARGDGSGQSTPSHAPQASTTAAVPPRLLEKYKRDIIPALTKQFNYKNPMQVPRLRKIVVNMGLGAAVANPKIIDTAVEELKAISGQRPVVTRAKKAIANFKLRAGIPIGAMVTLRRARMWEFLDRLLMVALPRTRDFKGVSRKAFDGRGNYTLGLREQIIFPEINYDKIDAIKGLNISLVTTAKSDEEGRALLQQLGMPFRAT